MKAWKPVCTVQSEVALVVDCRGGMPGRLPPSSIACERRICPSRSPTPSTDLLAVTDYCGIVSGREMAELHPITYALDNRHDRIGGPIGVGYSEGKGLKHLPR